ncbi:hypothetical protein MYAM1_003980 [Malassezia yamatoensis]|uniref:JmjC domain-containing protein n=1 Tax=Malassezia yamatoensis TaxID=253288 RepID=A0AAJ6CIB2_9BASI|nr:hypothetical protein MYAM1_003980 [Malassezia yamatoensis]
MLPTKYQGYEPKHADRIAKEPSTISAEALWENYVVKRRPVILVGNLDDKQWRGDLWTDLNYLREKAGSAKVRVEPIHPEHKVFGTSTRRENMLFADYLDSLQGENARNYYLTTQYELDLAQDDPLEQDLDKGPPLDTILPAPTNFLQDDFPLYPRVLGHLVLQQCNLWLGASSQPRSSGLHHDFHDNLYVLLSGHKRFVLFPPSAYESLHLRGEVRKIHPNGLLVYEDPGRIQADGLDALDAAHWRIAARARHLLNPPSKRKRLNHSEDQATAQKRYEDAKDTYWLLQETYANDDASADLGDWSSEGDIEDGQDEGDEEDEEDEEDVEEEENEEDEEVGEDEEDEEDGQDEEVEEAEDDKKDEDSADDLQDSYKIDTHNPPRQESKEIPTEPPSFSRIQPHVLHTHFQIESPIPAPSKQVKEVRPNADCPTPLVVDLQPGEMLYLPASWFHEVTSKGTPNTPHMAFNYWMHPPDATDFANPYKDKEVWQEIQLQIQEKWGKNGVQ